MKDVALKMNEYLIQLNKVAKQFNLNLTNSVFFNNILKLKPYETKQELNLSFYIYFDHNCFVKSEEFNF